MTGSDTTAPPLDRDSVETLLAYAIRAPSSHNAQPWLFRIGPSGVDVIADRTRALPVVDPDDRALVISCAAAAETLYVAARALGIDARVNPLPDQAEPDLLAHVSLRGRRSVTDADRALRDEILHRATYRRAFAPTIVSIEAGHALRAAAEPFGIDLVLVADQERRERIADLVVEGDRTQLADPRFRRELAQWIHPRRSGDGLSTAASPLADALTPLTAAIVRTFDVGEGQAAHDRDLVDHSPMLATFVSTADTVSDWIATGRALVAVSLAATIRGLAGSYLNQPIEVDALRQRLSAIVAPNGTPQLLMRFGEPRKGDAPLPRSARRPLDEVIL